MVDNFDRFFPDKQFHIDMWEDALPVVLKEAPSLFLKIKCDCYNCKWDKPVFIEVKASNEEGVTIKDAIEAMVSEKYRPDCSMITLTGFEQLSEDFFRPVFFV